MKYRPNLCLGLLLAFLLGVATYQGYRVRHLRESEVFYRWILGAANQVWVFGSVTPDREAAERYALKDEDVYQHMAEAIEPLLPEPEGEPAKEDYDENGALHSRLIRLVRRGTADKLIWRLASGRALAEPRKEFLTALSNKKLASVGTQFAAGSMYFSSESDDAGLGQPGKSGDVSLGSLFFGFRKMAANFTWLQVDRYWHQGLLYRMVPLMRTCVALDPHFIQAYLIGAWHLAYNATAHLPDTPEHLKKYYPKFNARLGEKELFYYIAIDFLRDGIRKNFRNYKLYFDLGYGIYENKLRDHANAVKYLEHAVSHRHERYVRRMLYSCYTKNGQYEEAIKGWQDYISAFAGTAVADDLAPRFIEINRGLIHERDGAAADKRADEAHQVAESSRKAAEEARQAAAQARAAGNAEEATRLDAEAEEAEARASEAYGEAQAAEEARQEQYAQARAIWEKLSAGEHPDFFALARLLRMRAVELVAEGNYLEAVALLDHARYQSNDFWKEGSDMIIDIKQKAGIPLNVTELKALVRREQEEKLSAAQTQQTQPPETTAVAPAGAE